MESQVPIPEAMSAWEVIGGALSGGLLVRTGKALGATWGAAPCCQTVIGALDMLHMMI